jgi:hypothetical protein
VKAIGGLSLVDQFGVCAPHGDSYDSGGSATGIREVIVMIRISLFLALAAMAASPVFAQSSATLSPGQVLRISPDGKTSTATMSMDPKMQSAMKKQAKKVTKGLVVWVNAKGEMFYLTNPVNPSWMTGTH